MTYSNARLQAIAKVIETFYSDPKSGSLWRIHPKYVNRYLSALVNVLLSFMCRLDL